MTDQDPTEPPVTPPTPPTPESPASPAGRRAILEMVARGEVTPEEAAELLAGHEGTDPGRGSEPGPVPEGGPAKRIRIKAALRSVVIEGDPSVAEAEPTGDHRAYREGDVLVISADSIPDFDDSHVVFAFSSGRTQRIRKQRHEGHDLGPRSLRIRVNPSIPLDTELDAGSISVRDVHSPIRVRVSAGSAKLTGLTEPIDAQVSAGSLIAQGRLDHGESVIVCDAGSVKFDLEKGSSVKVRARTSLGKVVLPGDPRGQRASGSGFGASEEQATTVGEGKGSLDITANLGKVVVRMDDGTTSSTSWEWRDR